MLTAGVNQPLALSARGVCAGYGRKQVVFDTSLDVAQGEVVSLFGHNGAGKSTLLRALFGLLSLTKGQVDFFGENVTQSCKPARNKRRGVALIPSDGIVFQTLSVLDNLKLGGTVERVTAKTTERLKFVQELFPILAQRRSQPAGTLSGGQQRMLVIGMALIATPRLLLLDEPSLGLSPTAVEDVFAALSLLVAEQHVSILLVEQNIRPALQLSNRVYTMRSGAVVREEVAQHMLQLGRTEWWRLL